MTEPEKSPGQKLWELLVRHYEGTTTAMVPSWEHVKDRKYYETVANAFQSMKPASAPDHTGKTPGQIAYEAYWGKHITEHGFEWEREGKGSKLGFEAAAQAVSAPLLKRIEELESRNASPWLDQPDGPGDFRLLRDGKTFVCNVWDGLGGLCASFTFVPDHPGDDICCEIKGKWQRIPEPQVPKE